ncbi:MAG: lipoprotein [Proteobacteria bacterium]|nr:lipoprotein [Pseudomonadota bacterium]MDA0908116.1 lipoprotein [Pseudomonadota bacterium]
MMKTQHSYSRFLAIMALLAAVCFTLTACGKRGDPYRPSEIPTDSSTLN